MFTSLIVAALTAQAAPVLRVQTTQYTSRATDYYRPGAAGQDATIGLKLDESRRLAPRLDGRVDLVNTYSGVEKWNYLDVREAYVRYREFSLGRQAHVYTEWERLWGQGVFEPRFLENKLTPDFAGQTGLFYARDGFVIGALPVFIPDFGPHWDVRDGKFVSANPWFHTPVAQFDYRGVTNEIDYSVDRPSDASVLAHPGLIAKWEDANVRVSYAYKPLPQLLYGFPSTGRFDTGREVMNIQVGVRVLYHQVLAADVMDQVGAWRVTGSLALERPDRDSAPVDWTTQQTRDATIVGLSASRPLEVEGPRAARVTLAFLKVDGGDAPDAGDLAGRISLFERRYQYYEAYRVQVEKPWRGWLREPLVTGAAVIYDRAQNGAVFSLTSALAFGRQWRADLRMDMLGLLGGTARVEDGFLATYRANDRVALGVNYAF